MRPDRLTSMMHSCQGMEIFLLQPCSALAAPVELTYSPPPPKTMMYHDATNLQLHTGNIEWGRGGGNNSECGKHRSVILQECHSF